MDLDMLTRFNDGMERLASEIERITALVKPEWDARRDTAKTLISLSAATLVFTITFSQSVVKPDTPLQWRYAIVGCWLSFIFSLVFCLTSLWFLMTLSRLPLLVKANYEELRTAFELTQRTGDYKPFMTTYMKPLRKLALLETVAIWCLRLGIIFYGLALSIFTVIGLRQLLH